MLVFVGGDFIVCVFPSLEFAAMRSSIVCAFVDVANFPGLEFSF